MDKPGGWTPEWQAALITANLEVPCFRSGISTYEFAELAGVDPGTVNTYARRGLEAFKKHFGEHCSFEVVGSRKQPFKRLYTFSGVIQPSLYQPPCPGVISSSEFAALHNLHGGSPTVSHFSRKGHLWFRRRFPGWDFLEIKSEHSSYPIRWYGRSEDIGEQPDEVLPDDNLTATQFARLKGITEASVRHAVQRGSEVFQQQFPGWSFYLAHQRPIFYRTGPEVETLTVSDFAKRMGYSTSFIGKLVKNDQLSEIFPDWQLRLSGLKTPKWLVCRFQEETDFLPQGTMSLKEFAEAARVSMNLLRNRIADHTFNEVYPEWQVQRDKQGDWLTCPIVDNVPLPPRSFIEINNLLTTKQFADLFEISDSTADAWFRNPQLLAERAPGWSVVQTKFSFYCKNWFKPPQ